MQTIYRVFAEHTHMCWWSGKPRIDLLNYARHTDCLIHTASMMLVAAVFVYIYIGCFNARRRGVGSAKIPSLIIPRQRAARGTHSTSVRQCVALVHIITLNIYCKTRRHSGVRTDRIVITHKCESVGKNKNDRWLCWHTCAFAFLKRRQELKHLSRSCPAYICRLIPVICYTLYLYLRLTLKTIII